MPYRILMIAPTSFFSDYGCHVRILEEARTLQAHGQRVQIVTYYKGRSLPDLEIIRTAPTPWHADYEVGSSRHKIAFDVLLSWTALKTALRFKPHIIHAHLHEGALIGSALSWISRAPLVFDFQGSLTGEMIDHHFLNPAGPAHAIVRRLERRIDHRPRAILTSSRTAVALLRDTFGVDPERVIPLPDCVDTAFFRPRTEADRIELSAIRSYLGVPADRELVVYLGLLAPYQGTDLLIEAAEQVIRQRPNTHFLIMGYPGMPLYRALAEARGLSAHTTFVGRVLYEDAPRYLRLGDVAVAPKLSATEANGKVLNYMATGLPTIAFNTPINREYLHDYGFYARPGDAAALAEQLLYALNTPSARACAAAGLRARAQAMFAWEDAARRIVAVYDAVRLRRAGERTQALQELGFGRHLESRHLESRHLESRHPEGRHLEGWHPEGRHLEDRHLEGRHPEGRHPEGRHLEMPPTRGHDVG
ncbi:MAG TPA: glycosyltransferase family 4 protein [Anaerolineae bacterium]|nr:glycosyltransferase family 4 protein [Anaerolineae bacterium]